MRITLFVVILLCGCRHTPKLDVSSDDRFIEAMCRGDSSFDFESNFKPIEIEGWVQFRLGGMRLLRCPNRFFLSRGSNNGVQGSDDMRIALQESSKLPAVQGVKANFTIVPIYDVKRDQIILVYSKISAPEPYSISMDVLDF